MVTSPVPIGFTDILLNNSVVWCHDINAASLGTGDTNASHGAGDANASHGAGDANASHGAGDAITSHGADEAGW